MSTGPDDSSGSNAPIFIGIALLAVVGGTMWFLTAPSDDGPEPRILARAVRHKTPGIDRMKNTTPIKLPPGLQRRINGPRLKTTESIRAGAPRATDAPPPQGSAPAEASPAAEPNGSARENTDDVDALPGDRPLPQTGTLSKDAIQASIRAVTPKIKACFDQGLKQDPSLAGKVVVEFEIEADDDGHGVVQRGEVKSAVTQSPFFEACVLKEVAGAKFDAPEGGGKLVVRYPFKFDPGGGFGGAPGEAAGDDQGGDGEPAGGDEAGGQ